MLRRQSPECCRARVELEEPRQGGAPLPGDGAGPEGLLSGHGIPTRQVLHHFRVLENLVKEARQLTERADGTLPPTPTNEETYDFARQCIVFHENPNLWFSVGRIGGELLISSPEASETASCHFGRH